MLKNKIIAFEQKRGKRDLSLRRAFNEALTAKKAELFLRGGGKKKKRQQNIDLQSYRNGLDEDGADAYNRWTDRNVVMFGVKERTDPDSLLLVWIAVKNVTRPINATRDGSGEKWGRTVSMETTESGTTEYHGQQRIRIVRKEHSIDVNALRLQGHGGTFYPLREKQKYDILRMAAGIRTTYMRKDESENIYYDGLHGNYYIYNGRQRLKHEHIFNIVGTLANDIVILDKLDKRLYLGSELSANVVKDNKEWAIVRLGGNKVRKKLDYSAPDDFHDENLTTENEKQGFLGIMAKASDAIDRALKAGKKVLVHCEQGINRSVASIVFWAARYKNADVEQTIHYVRNRNKERNKNLGALTNSTFESILLNVKPKSHATSSQAKSFSSSMSMGERVKMQYKGKEVSFVVMAVPGSRWKHHAFFAPKIQKLFVSKDDWAWLKQAKTTHEGAFGSDFKVSKSFSFRGYSKWVEIWKFPSDLNYKVDGFRGMYGFLIPVGAYGMIPDYETGIPKYPGTIPIGSVVTKERYEEKKGSGGIHRVVNGQKAHAFITTMGLYAKTFWGEPEGDIVGLVNDLRKIGLVVFSCHNQHHGIVFYYDLKENKPITPGHLADLLSKHRGKTIANMLKKYVVKEDGKAKIDAWVRNYVKFFK